MVSKTKHGVKIDMDDVYGCEIDDDTHNIPKSTMLSVMTPSKEARAPSETVN